MRTTDYYRKIARYRHPEVKPEWIEAVLSDPLLKEIQIDGRIRLWGAVAEKPGFYLRVVTLRDGRTVHNAFLDRNFRPQRDQPEGK